VTRWCHDEGQQHECAENAVGRCEDAWFRLIKEDVMHAVGDEVSSVGDVAGLVAQPILPGRQGTRDPTPRLEHHDDNRRHVRQPKRDIADPLPTPQQPEQNRNLAEDDEGNITRVDDDYNVGEDSVESRHTDRDGLRAAFIPV